MTGVSFRELTAGAGCSIVSATPGPDLRANGFGENEYAVSGVATRFAPRGPRSVIAIGEDRYTTRILVRRPLDDADFSGTVVVEWLNVSSGSDAAPEYTYLADEVIRSGHAWVGVSTQFTGITGGPASVDGLDGPSPRGLAVRDPKRYAGLHHPGDAYSYDIFGGIGAVLRSPDTADHPLTGLTVRQLLAVGESQSAMALTTYANLFTTVHDVYSGILIHSRAAAGMSLGDVGAGVDIDRVFDGEPATVDSDVPVFVVQTETDVLTDFASHRVRQPDTDRLRIWEIAGTAHADLHQIGPYEHMLGCPTPVNRGQQRFVLRAALRHLHGWAGGADPPPVAAPLEIDRSGPTTEFVVDEIGNVRGGVRTPCVEAPTQVLSGIVRGDVSRLCRLFGSTTSADPEAIGRRYRGRTDYLERYHRATDAAIDAGFVLSADRAELLADARPDLVAERTSVG